jgi:hypothetical protein
VPDRHHLVVDLITDLGVVVAAVLAGLALATRTDGPEAEGSGPARADLIAAIERLPVAEPSAAGPYDRAQFPHWIDIAAGCDTRCAVLDRQRTPTGWVSVYDGYVTRDAGDLEVDHVVPLAEAWISGASTWSLDRRQAFANDLASGELLAVSGWSNRSKEADDPATWRPPDPAWWCRYAQAWVGVKLRWSLSADPAEIGGLRDLAESC